MYRVMLRAHRWDPNDVVIRNNVAALGLLLNKDLKQNHRLASEVYDEAPANPAIATTYAFSLFVQGRTVEGLAALEPLSAQSAKNSTFALYYAVLQAGAGNPELARGIASQLKEEDFLPEEWALLGRLRSG